MALLRVMFTEFGVPSFLGGIVERMGTMCRASSLSMIVVRFAMFVGAPGSLVPSITTANRASLNADAIVSICRFPSYVGFATSARAATGSLLAGIVGPLLQQPLAISGALMP